MREESSQLGLEINWNKTKIQAPMYLGSCSEPDGESDMDIRRRIELDCTCIKALNRGIWRMSLSLSTKLRFTMYIYTISTSLQSRHMEYDCSVQTTS